MTQFNAPRSALTPLGVYLYSRGRERALWGILGVLLLGDVIHSMSVNKLFTIISY